MNHVANITADLRAFGVTVLEGDVEQVVAETQSGRDSCLPGCSDKKRALHNAIRQRVARYLTELQWSNSDKFDHSQHVYGYRFERVGQPGMRDDVCLDPGCLFFYAGRFGEIGAAKPIRHVDLYDDGLAITCASCNERLDGLS